MYQSYEKNQYIRPSRPETYRAWRGNSGSLKAQEVTFRLNDVRLLYITQ